MRTVYRVFLPGLLACIFGMVQPAPAQTINARLDVSSGQPVQGDQIEVEVRVDLSSVPDKLSAYDTRLNWDAQVL